MGEGFNRLVLKMLVYRSPSSVSESEYDTVMEAGKPTTHLQLSAASYTLFLSTTEVGKISG